VVGQETSVSLSDAVERLRMLQDSHPGKNAMATVNTQGILVAPSTPAAAWEAAVLEWTYTHEKYTTASVSLRETMQRANIAKHKHLIFQLEALVGLGKIGSAYATTGVPALQSLVDALQAGTPPPMDQATRDIIMGLVDRPIYLPELPTLRSDAEYACSGGTKPCLGDNSEADWEQAQRAYVAAEGTEGQNSGFISNRPSSSGMSFENGVVVVDDFLTPESFEAMRHLGETAVVFDDPKRGYLGACACALWPGLGHSVRDRC
jgi:hypothetical protein